MKTSVNTFSLWAGLLLSTVIAVQAQEYVTFQVDMGVLTRAGAFVPANDDIQGRGGFNNWSGGFNLTNNPAAVGQATNIYSGVFAVDTNVFIPDSNPLVVYKFAVDKGRTGNNVNYEANNRNFYTSNGVTAMTLPVVYFNDETNIDAVTFQVDMTVGVQAGKFTPGTDYVECRGGFQGWAGGFTMTNNPNAANTNLYSGVYFIIGTPGSAQFYKFVVNGGSGPLGWESPPSGVPPDLNRTFTLAPVGGAQVLPVVFFNDVALSDLLAVDTLVTFSVNMTNAVGYLDAHVFDSAVDSVYLNGVYNSVPNSFWPWGVNPPVPAMTNNPPGSKIYTTQVLFPAGTILNLTYKYGINGLDDEAGTKTNHIRYIRTPGNYTLPLDTFGNQYVEQSFGNLAIGKKSGGNVPVTWLGRPGVYLQTKTSLTSGAWVNHPETDSLNSTNLPAGSGNQYLRLIKPN